MIRTWSGKLTPLPGVTVIQPGGHFPGSAVVHWANGAEGKGVLLSGDTIFANPDRTSVSFMRSYPNRIPLSGAVVDRVAKSLDPFEYDRLYNNFGSVDPGRRQGRRTPLGRPPRRLGPRRLRPPDLIGAEGQDVYIYCPGRARSGCAAERPESALPPVLLHVHAARRAWARRVWRASMWRMQESQS